MIKNRIIDGLRFPQFKCTFTGLNAAAFCHGSHGVFNTFDKRAAANGNTFRPPAFPFGIGLFQCGLNPSYIAIFEAENLNIGCLSALS